VAANITIELCAPERRTLTLEASEVQLPGGAGVLTILPGHTPVLTTLGSGVMMVHPPQGGPAQFFAISAGFAEIANDRINILADTFEAGEDIDLDRAKQAREQAEATLKQGGDNRDILRAELAIARAMARIHAHSREGY
jgi:F-type H+-transporting ATPase subunit epsilon